MADIGIKLPAKMINSFPSTKRASKNKLMTEHSVTRLINRLLDVDSYVITSEIFPLVREGTDSVGVTEENLDAILNGTASNNSIVDGILASEWSGKDFEFNIHGYYFCISATRDASGTVTSSGLENLMTAASFPGSGSDTLYARIYVDGVDSDYPELYGQDAVELPDVPSNSIIFYKGSQTPPTDPEIGPHSTYTLPLLKFEDGISEPYVPFTSLFRLDTRAIRTIDGGEI